MENSWFEKQKKNHKNTCEFSKTHAQKKNRLVNFINNEQIITTSFQERIVLQFSKFSGNFLDQN